MSGKKQPFGYKKDPALKLTKNGLKLREEDFCQAYLIDFNASRAARASGYSTSSGFTLLKKARIQARIFNIRKESGKAFDVTREKILQELMRIAYSDVRNVEAKPIEDWEDDDAAAVAGIEYDLIGSVKKVTRYDKLKAIEMINRMMGYNAPEKVDTTNKNFNSEPMSREDIKRISKELDDYV